VQTMSPGIKFVTANPEDDGGAAPFRLRLCLPLLSVSPLAPIIAWYISNV
ncbi:MAG: hypothetical protein ACI90V_007193, partial [Bacillariaceae sp.]